MPQLTDRYGTMVFSDKVMQEYLPTDVYRKMSDTIKRGMPLDLDVANAVAHAMKEWALSKGATHFAHWFQPLTGITSEKHDSFIEPRHDGTALAKFSGKELIQGEPDASSFPSGGLRATFEARGYSAWDPTSYAFIKDEVLCIPTAFCSYNGEALDKKTPLLRSMAAIDTQVKRVLKLFGKTPSHVDVNVGCEQEYFLIPESMYEKRQDLMMTGRTLFGAPPCKGQELDEHYFGAIRPTVNNFMKELDDVLWGYAVAAKTKHNEVAPAQHELAPVFCSANRAVDENLLTMEQMKLLASHSGLVCLQHEKPFEGINGSGKHNNWSISADSENLLDPGDTPEENLQFAVFLTCVIEAVDNYQELLRMSIASNSNDHRLGADEAPPAIVSIFLGDELNGVVEGLVSGEMAGHALQSQLDFGVDVLPTFDRDTTDRNRTSPFAFTGNKFEFRMPGSSINVSDANMVLITAMAKSLKDFADAMEKGGDTD
ncbi:MAG: glutamine synthetase III, partial [Eggerthellaceae bacterium]|nr:glutamine synthetase III [Eggerthellaceae bacterium]